MSEISKGALTSENNNSFPNNNTGYITPTILRTFNQNMIDSLVDEISYTAESASFNSRINAVSGSGIDTGSFETTSSFNAYTASNDSKVNALIAATGSFITESETGSFATNSTLNAYTASQSVISASFDARIDALETGSAPAGTVSSSAQIAAFGYATTGSNTFRGNQIITGSTNIDGDLYLDDDGGTTSFLINRNFDAEFKGFKTQWQEGAKSASVTTAEENVEIVYNGWGGTYDNGFVVNVDANGTALKDWNPSYVNQTWLQVPVNNGSNPAPQMKRGLGITGSVGVVGNATIVGNTSLSGSINVSGSATFNGQNVFNGTNVFNTPITASAVRVNGDVVATGAITASSITATSASFQYVQTTYETASIIYSSGSNQFGDDANDTQTLYGGVNVVNALTASGLRYPTADNGVESFIQTDGAGNLSLQYVKTIYQNIRNSETSSIVKGTPLYVSGSTGDNANVYIADAGNPNRMPATLIAGDATLAANATGKGIILGHIEGVDTTGYAPGTEVFVGVGGGWTSTRPTGSSTPIQPLGVVTREGSNGMGIVLTQVPFDLPNLQTGYTWVGNGTNQPTAVATSSFVINTGSFATTGSNSFNGNQTIASGDLYVRANPNTGDYNGVSIDRNNLNYSIYNFSTSSAIFDMGAVDGNSFTYSTEFIVEATPQQILLKDFNLGNYSYNNWLRIAQNTGQNPRPQFVRGLEVTSSFYTNGNNVLGDSTTDTTTINGLTTINGNGEATVALQIVSGSVEVIGPRGNGGHFYTNLPITSSQGRINGTFIVKDLIVSGTWGGEGQGSLQVEGDTSISGTFFASGSSQFNQALFNLPLTASGARINGEQTITGTLNATGDTRLGNELTDTHIISGAVNILGSFDVNGNNIINQVNSLIAATSSYITSTTGLATTGSNTFSGTQTLTNGDLIVGANPTTGIYNGLMLDKSGLNYTIYNVSTSSAALNIAATDGNTFSYSTELLLTATPSQLTFQDFSTGDYSYKTWLAIPQNTGGNPAPQFKRGLTATGSLNVTGSTIVTGSVVGNVSTLSISSNTASLNLNNGNFFTLQLVEGTNTFINPSNIKAGQTINIRVNTTGSATVSFPSSVKQPSGSSYIPTAVTGTDIVTLVSFDSSTLYLANVKNLI